MCIESTDQVGHALTLSALLDHLARTRGDHPAIHDGAETLTFAELAYRVSRVATGLAALRVGPGDVVAIWLPNSTKWVEAAFAGCRRGAIVLGVNTKYRSFEVRQTLAESKARVLIVWPAFHGIDFLGMLGEIADDLPPTLEHVVTLGEVEPGRIPQRLRPLVRSWESLHDHGGDGGSLADPAAAGHAFSSSGSTSAPKLVLHSQRGMVLHSYAVARSFGYLADDTVVLGALPFCGVFGFNTLLAAFAAGRPVVIQAVFTAESAVELMRRHAVTHTNLADEMLRRIIHLPGALEALPAWREAGFGNFTATDPAGLVRAGDAAGKTFFQTYGSSEVLALMCYPRPGADAGRRALGGGVPVSPTISFRIRDPETGELVQGGATGEIEIAGPNVTIGYLNRPRVDDLGADGYFRTGDLGYARDEADLVYLSRRGDALRLGGFLVNPREVEAFLEALPGITGAQLVGVHGPSGTVPVAFVLADPSLDEAAVIAECAAHLARFKVPRRVLVLEEFPIARGTNGDKIQRNKLRELATRALAPSETRR
ncbi:AMP-binding protein [Prauserella flavalba]|uniref:Long-chain-fatty-acid--CoA ligase n=1 Tax=Prauserella flavalba TaxID=1477506 RepID=A0A318LBS4_9PSEU|nr:AMP-binding protein [Prauserella flavalba]PXY21495.1 hypothetical protein BA062_31790 [Prauserella flavalba]